MPGKYEDKDCNCTNPGMPKPPKANHQKLGQRHEQDSGSQPEEDIDSDDLCGIRSVKQQCLLLKPPSLWHFVTAVLTN